jgi:hypothetical protein
MVMFEIFNGEPPLFVRVTAVGGLCTPISLVPKSTVGGVKTTGVFVASW